MCGPACGIGGRCFSVTDGIEPGVYSGPMDPDALPDGSRCDAEAFAGLDVTVGVSPRSFSLNVAVCDDPALRDALFRQLTARHGDIETVALWPYESEVFEHVHARMSDRPRDALFVVGLEDALAADIDRAALLAHLSASPPRWKAWFACPVVFWVDAHTASILRANAPDFWEWQTGVFRLDG